MGARRASCCPLAVQPWQPGILAHPPSNTMAPPCLAADTAKFGRFHRGMLEQGVYLAPSQFEAGFTSLAHTEEDIDRTIEAARKVLASL